MSVPSSSSNASLPPSSLSSSINIHFVIQKCFHSTTGAYIITTFTITSSLVLLPVCIPILYHGVKQRQLQRSSTMMSHSDFITYHMVITELLSIFGSLLFCCGLHTDLPGLMMVGIFIWSVNIFAQMFFHTLTCVERYLAVVHPITYLSLKTTKGIRIRNITVGCVWLLCCAGMGLMSLTDQLSSVIISICIMSVALLIMSFCSLSVLYVLIRPGPGEGGGDRQRVGQSKLRAFYTIMAILGVLLFRFVGNILVTALYSSPKLRGIKRCHVWFIVIWFSLPSSLVLPLLFLQRAGKLVCCKNNNTSGQGSD